jgi:hypothetical protein
LSKTVFRGLKRIELVFSNQPLATPSQPAVALPTGRLSLSQINSQLQATSFEFITLHEMIKGYPATRPEAEVSSLTMFRRED